MGTVSYPGRQRRLGAGYSQADGLLRLSGQAVMTQTDTVNVLFLCTGNSARSILGEKLVEQVGGSQFRGFSAGSDPKGEVHPLAIALLESRGIPIEGLRSKHWNEYEGSQAPHMHVVLTVCDNAAAETCPVWPGHPVSGHWGIPDPAAAAGDHETRFAAFERAARQLEDRIRDLRELPFDSLDEWALRQAINQIGRRRHESEIAGK